MISSGAKNANQDGSLAENSNLMRAVRAAEPAGRRKQQQKKQHHIVVVILEKVVIFYIGGETLKYIIEEIMRTKFLMISIALIGFQKAIKGLVI